jgi:GcrA cell cycle regulator
MTAFGISSEKTWTAERVALLKSYVNTGLSCGQIADEIGVSRNAVIGKINRLGLSRGRSAAAPRTRVGAPMRRLQGFTPRQAFQALLAPESVAEEVVSAQPCSLLDLAPGNCRWPISTVGNADFTFCGNTNAAGMSYCAGHARMAYRLSAPTRKPTGRSYSCV